MNRLAVELQKLQMQSSIFLSEIIGDIRQRSSNKRPFQIVIPADICHRENPVLSIEKHVCFSSDFSLQRTHTDSVIITWAINQEQTCWLLNWDLGQLRNVNTMLLFVKLEWLLMCWEHSLWLASSSTPHNGWYFCRNDFQKGGIFPHLHVYL